MPAAEAGPRPPWRDLALLVATSTLVGATISLNLPLLSLVLQQAGWDAGTIGLNATASSLGIFPLIPLVPALVRGLGARGCILAGALMAAVAMLLLPLRLDFFWWYGLRLVIGTGTSLVFITSEAAINALVPPQRRGRVIALYATVFSLGYVAGPLVVALAGTRGWLPFVLSAALFALGALPVLAARRLDEGLRQGPTAYGPAAWLRVLRRGAPALGVIFVFGLVETAVFALWPVHAQSRGTSESLAAALISLWIAGNFALQYPIGWLADRLPRPRLIAASSLLAAVLFLLLALLPPTAPPALAALGVVGGLVGSLYSLALGLLGERFRGLDLALANTAFVATIQAGAVLGPALAGGAMAAFGPTALPLGLALAIMPLLALGWPRGLTGSNS